MEKWFFVKKKTCRSYIHDMKLRIVTGTKNVLIPMSNNTDRLLNSAVHKRQNYDQIRTVVSIDLGYYWQKKPIQLQIL